MPKLIYHDSDGVDKVLNVGAEPLLIGRATECQIQTQDAMVSRRHARIYWDGNYWIEDLGSSNGVYVGQQKVQKAPFRPGDTVTCGSLVLRLMPDTSPRLPTGALPAQAAAQQLAHDNTMLPPPGVGQYGAPPPAAPGFPPPPAGMQYGAPPPAAPSYAPPPPAAPSHAPPPADAYAPPPPAPVRPAPVAPREVSVGPNAVLRSNPAPTAAQPSNMSLELDDERRRRISAEQAASAAEERANAAESRAAELEASAKEANLLKRKVDQLTADMRRLRGGAPAPEESTRDEGERQARMAAEAERDRLQRTVDDLQRRLASGGGAPAGPDPETDRLRRQVDQMTSELRRLRAGQPAAPEPPPPAPAAPDPALADAVILLGDSLAELRASLRAANDEAGLLTAPTESVQVIREALQTAADQLENARNSLRSAAKILGV